MGMVKRQYEGLPVCRLMPSFAAPADGLIVVTACRWRAGRV
jgi:hypothetical protein